MPDPLDPNAGAKNTGGRPVNKTPLGSEQSLIDLAGRVEQQETERYEQGLGTLTDAFRQSQEALSQGLDENLLFSRAADAVGARGKANLSAMRQSLGGRGISPNSGAAGGMLQRMMMSQEGQLIGAKRDIGIYNDQQRAVRSAQGFSNALNLAQYTNAPVSGAMLETSQNIFEGNLAREGIAAMAESQRQASRDRKAGTMGSSVLGLAGSAATGGK